MDSLKEKFTLFLEETNIDFKRYLYNTVPWHTKMMGIVGARGVGKSTMMLQYIKENLNKNESLYVVADDLYFINHRIYDLADEFYKNGGKYLFIDEIHKYKDWSMELKNIYDSYPRLNIIFSGSSILDILKGTHDLSRRALVFNMKGLSFREYLNFNHHFNIPAYSFEQIIHNQYDIIKKIQHPLPLFKEYLKNGYYPYSKDDFFRMKLGSSIIQTLETDIPIYANMNVSTVRKLKQLLGIVAESAPFKPNFKKISEMLNVSRNSLDDYFIYMEQAGLINQLRDKTGGIRGLGKVNKVYLENPNLIYCLSSENAKIGNIRETYFYNQMRVNQDVISSKQSDFVVGKYTFEVGGKSKGQKQIERIENSFVVKDDIEYGYNNVIPLWAFGLNY